MHKKMWFSLIIDMNIILGWYFANTTWLISTIVIAIAVGMNMED